MNYLRRLCLLICTYFLLLGLSKADQEGKISEILSPKSFSQTIDSVSTTESLLKKRNTVLDLKNNNILRDKNIHPYISKDLKLMMSDLNKDSKLKKSDASFTDHDGLKSNQTDGVTSSVVTTNINFSEKYDSNVIDILPRNTRDLISNPDLSIKNDSEVGNFTVINTQPNSSSNSAINEEIPISGGHVTSLIFSSQNSTLNLTDMMRQVNSSSTTSSPVLIKNPKDKKNKTKELNSEQFKKPSNNLKNKANVIVNNSSIEAIKPESTIEYFSTVEPIKSNFSENATELILSGNGTTKYISNNVTTSSLKTLPEAEGLQSITIVLLVVGSIALILIIAALGMFSVVMYRRYHWNKPQTFSDKCSNADSTGYIDDNTLKENSEEMYSLDNDSFLNSLEAMTIQNYWADSIRHTKL